jgi:hypothetical protein
VAYQAMKEEEKRRAFTIFQLTLIIFHFPSELDHQPLMSLGKRPGK